MENIHDWAAKHHVSEAAVAELTTMLGGMPHVTAASTRVQSETAGQQQIRLRVGNYEGGYLWRNNVGAFYNERGMLVRYGLCNDSKRVNAETKSSDLIGLIPIRILPVHVGKLVAVFTSIETKKGSWWYAATPREVAQHRYMSLVRVAGGISGFARGVEDFDGIVSDYTDALARA